MPGIGPTMRLLSATVSGSGMRAITVLFFLFAGPFAYTQTDTIRALPPVTIVDAPSVRTGFSVWYADSIPEVVVLSLSERLLWEMPLGVRANAPGTLATVSARGAGPSRTAVYWQGLNLQSPMNGVVDVSLVPLWPGDQVDIQYGGQSAASSTGAMGGILRITPAIMTDSLGWQASIGGSAGAFGRLGGQAAIAGGTPRLRTAARAAWHRAENNFPFTNTASIGAPSVRQVNNFGEKLDLQQFNQFRINEKNTVETAVWYHGAFREIPPAMTEAPSQTWQRDRALRAVATWSVRPGGRYQWQHRAAWLNEHIAFYLNGDTDSSRSRTLLLASELIAAPVDRLALRASITGWHVQARADGYADNTAWFLQNRLAGTMSAEYRWRVLRISAQIRQEWAERQGAPFTWALGGQWAAMPELTVRLHLSSNFNLPTFNDRFWRTLGNPDLRPESGYSTDVGLQWKRGTYQLETTVFQMHLDDWILWQPGSDGLFRPGNLRAVRSRGIEINGQGEMIGLGSRWRLKTRYQFVQATNTAVYGGNAAVLGKLLPYTPEHSAGASLLWSKGFWSAAYLHQWTGSRFVNADNSRQLTGFRTGNMLLQYTATLWHHRLSLSMRLENIWNTPYQVIAFRPMPGRAWQVGVVWQ